MESWTVLVQLNGSYSALSPVVHGGITLSINTNTKKIQSWHPKKY